MHNNSGNKLKISLAIFYVMSYMFSPRFIIVQLAFLSLAAAQPVFAQTPEANVVSGKYLKSMETTFIDDEYQDHVTGIVFNNSPWEVSSIQIFVALFNEENQFLKMNIGPSLIQKLSAGEESHFSIPVYGVEEGDSVRRYVVFAHGDVAN
jgi:hypothetical protein